MTESTSSSNLFLYSYQIGTIVLIAVVAPPDFNFVYEEVGRVVNHIIQAGVRAVHYLIFHHLIQLTIGSDVIMKSKSTLTVSAFSLPKAISLSYNDGTFFTRHLSHCFLTLFSISWIFVMYTLHGEHDNPVTILFRYELFVILFEWMITCQAMWALLCCTGKCKDLCIMYNYLPSSNARVSSYMPNRGPL